MRNFILLIIALFLHFVVFAQLEVKGDSFKEVNGFVNINPDYDYQFDDNELPFAVIKVRTVNINDKQRRELKFEGNAGTFIMIEYKTGEVWVYLTAKYANYLKISHPDLSSTEFTFPQDLKPKHGYELTLISNEKKEIDVYGNLIIKVNQPEARIYIDNEFVGTGYVSKIVAVNKEHRYKILLDGYYTREGIVYFEKREDKEIDVELEPNFGYITITSDPSGADIYIDNVKVGVTPYQVKKVKLGQHAVELRKYGYLSYADVVTINVGDHNKRFENVKMDRDGNKANKTETSSSKQLRNVFSVGIGKYVVFAKGNLQYQASTKTWRFADQQWVVLGDKNKDISSKNSGWIDLFGWGTGDDPTKNSKKDSDYEQFTDWGNNAISNSEGKKWHTPTDYEWNYIFNVRNTQSGIRYVKATVNGVNGIVLLPNDWDKSVYVFIAPNKPDVKFNTNTINLNDWKYKLEANGAVFLPAADFRHGSSIMNINARGYYWSSTHYDYDKISAHGVYFEQENLLTSYLPLCHYGLSVRLISFVQ